MKICPYGFEFGVDYNSQDEWCNTGECDPDIFNDCGKECKALDAIISLSLKIIKKRKNEKSCS